MNRSNIQHILLIIIIYLVCLTGGLLLITNLDLSLSPAKFSTLATIMALITLGAYLIIVAGMKKPGRERIMFLLLAIGGKFLGYLIMLLLFWIPAKNLSPDFIIAFFVLYLAFTIFLLSILYKMLKAN